MTDRQYGKFWEFQLSSVIAVAVIAWLAITLRGLYAFQRQWWDEDVVIDFTTQYNPLELLWQVPIGQPHFGSYYALVDGWATITGLPVLTGRVISVAAGLGIVAAIYWLATKWPTMHGTRGIAVGLALTCPVLVIQSGWLRMYALLTLSTTLSWGVLSRRGGTWTWAGLAVATAWIHPYGIFVAVSQILWLVFPGRMGSARKQIAVVLAGVVPAVGVLVAKIFSEYLPIYPRRTVAASTLRHLPAAPDALEVLLLPVGLILGRLSLLPQIIAVTVVLACLAYGIGWQLGQRWVGVCLWWAIAPILMAVVASYAVTPIFQLKYLVVSLPPLLLLLAAGINNLEPKWRWAAFAVILTSNVTTLVVGLSDPTWFALRVLP